MEKHFLNDYVDGTSEFQAEPWYNPYGDCVVFQTVDEAVVADRIDDVLTVYRSAVDDRPIGFQVKGVQAIVRQCGLDGLAIESEVKGDTVRSISVALLLLAAYEIGPPNTRRRKAYAQAQTIGTGLSDRGISVQDLIPM